MILIIGGLASGKHEYVAGELGYDDSQIADAIFDDRPVLINLNDLIKSNNFEIDDDFYGKLLSKEVITCCEVGSGIVPLDRRERDYRESVGRICIELAKNANKVIRMYCGIPTVIKEDR